MASAAKFVAYEMNGGGLMRAWVETRHRDGSMTVQPWWCLDDKGNDCGAFQGGFKVRLRPSDVLPLPAQVQP
jgi:hypothetical protein